MKNAELDFDRKLVSGGLGWVMSPTNKFMPQIVLDAEDGTGSGGGDDKAADDKAADESKKEESAKKEDDASKDDSGSKSKPSAKEAELLKEVMEKKEKLKQTQKEVEAVKAQLKEFEGIDPAAIRELLKEKANAEKAAAEAKGDFDRVKQMMVDEHNKEVEKVRAEKEAAATALADALAKINDLTIGDSFHRSTFIKDELILTPAKARTIYGAHFDMEDGKIVAYDKPRGAANRTMLVDGSGDALSFEAAVRKLVEADPDKDSILRSKLKEGAGSKPAADKAKSEETSAVAGVSRIAAALSDLKLLKS